MECLLGFTYGYRIPPSSSSSCSGKVPQKRKGRNSQALIAASAMSGDATARSHCSIISAKATSRPLATAHGNTAECKTASPSATTVAPAAAGAGGRESTAGVVSCSLGRLLDELGLFPTAAQLHLVDKKFGGEKLWHLPTSIISWL